MLYTMNLEEYRDKENESHCSGFTNDLIATLNINLYVHTVTTVFNICRDRRKLLLPNS